MSETAAEPAAEVDQWLSSFEDALDARGRRGGRGAVPRRQLLARPRRLHLEHQDGRGPGRRPGHARARRSRAHEAARLRHDRAAGEAEGVTEAWIEFETETGRGHGPPAPEGRQGVDAADRAAASSRATRSRAAPAARRAPSTAPTATARPGWRSASARPRSSATTTPARRRDRRRRPGRHRARRAAAAARRPDDHRRAQRAPRRLVAQALQVAVPARPGLVRPPALHQVPRELARVLAEGQDRRLAGDVHAGDGAQLLELHEAKSAQLRRGRRASGSSSSSATARTSRCARSSSCWRTGMSGKPNVPEIPGMDVFKGDQHHSSQHPGPGRLPRQEGGRDRLQQLRARHLRGAVGGTAPT